MKMESRADSVGDDGGRTKKGQNQKFADPKIFVVWLESFEDSFHFPSGMRVTDSIQN